MSTPQRQGGNRGLDTYVGVHLRIEQFRAQHPAGRILTQIVKDEPLTVRAEVYFEENESGIPNGVGHADEGGGMGNRGRSALEMTETAAVGRALAFCGYEVKEGIASREEMASPLRPVQIGPPKPLEQPSSERRELLESVTARCIELGYDTAKQLTARAKAAKMSDDEIVKKVIPSLDKLIEARHKEESRLRTAINAEFARTGYSDEDIAEYMQKNEEFHGGGVLLEQMPLEQLKKVAEGLEIK